MTSQGQRFRRRALRRGYKVDEVDLFLDRVEATLNGDRVDSPVRSNEVHDVVFRVRFGGYDEWQVDLHLDRVERQLADQEPGEFGGDRLPADRLPERPLDRMPDRMPERMSAERLPDRPVDRMPERMPERLPERIPERMPAPGLAGAGMGAAAGAANPYDRLPNDRGPATPPRDMGPGPRDDRMMPPGGGGRPPAAAPPGWNDPGSAARPAPAGYQRAFERPEPDYTADPYDNEPTYSGFEPGRRARPDMTTEMRMPDVSAPSGAGPAAGPGPGMGGPPPSMAAPGPSGPGMPGAGGGPGSVPPGEVQRIDQLRRTFQLRRFGSGYDRAEVDRLFEGVISAMSGRSTMPIAESELDPGQFNLVPGGYFESEVDQALREVRDIIRRR